MFWANTWPALGLPSIWKGFSTTEVEGWKLQKRQSVNTLSNEPKSFRFLQNSNFFSEHVFVLLSGTQSRRSCMPDSGCRSHVNCILIQTKNRLAQLCQASCSHHRSAFSHIWCSYSLVPDNRWQVAQVELDFLLLNVCWKSTGKTKWLWLLLLAISKDWS